MKKLIYKLSFALLFIGGCTDNEMARKYGGTETVELKENEKFINITWKETSLWVIVQDTITGNYIAREKSSFGIIEGKVIIKPYGNR
jgi:hypothetical protein